MRNREEMRFFNYSSSLLMHSSISTVMALYIEILNLITFSSFLVNKFYKYTKKLLIGDFGLAKDLRGGKAGSVTKLSIK